LKFSTPLIDQLVSRQKVCKKVHNVVQNAFSKENLHFMVITCSCLSVADHNMLSVLYPSFFLSHFLVFVAKGGE
jgi:hypothetical protein